MSRLKRHQNIDGLINILHTIAQNQCSLSENERNLLDSAIAKLQFLRKRKGLTDKHFQSEIVDIVELILSFFTK